MTLCYTITGVYDTINELSDPNTYILSDGKFISTTRCDTPILPFSIYLKISDKNSIYENNTHPLCPEQIDLRVIGDINSEDAVLFEIDKGENYYDLFGRCIENPMNGIYIIKGKKIYAK